MVGHGDAESVLAQGRNEPLPPKHGLQPGKQLLQLEQQSLPLRRALVGAPSPDQELIPKLAPQAGEGSAHRRLAQETTLRRAGHVPLLQQHVEGLEKVQVRPPNIPPEDATSINN